MKLRYRALAVSCLISACGRPAAEAPPPATATPPEAVVAVEVPKAENQEPLVRAEPESAGAVPGGATKEVRASGLVVEDLVIGQGEEATVGRRVVAHYDGRLEDGTKFDSSVDRGTPFEFELGKHHVIKGWEEGLIGMRVGGRRRLTIPAELGYGTRGARGKIPPNATLVFEIQLLELK